MSEIEFSIPPYTVDDICGTLSEAKAEHVGYQIRGWQADKIWTEFGIKGEGVTVGVGDTGVSRSHLNGDLQNVKGQKSFVGDNNPYDRNSHGSHCLGIIGARSNSSGMIGFAPECDLYSAKVLSDRGSGGDGGISKGIVWLADQGCKVISLSLGSPQSSSTINAAIKYAMTNGVLVFAAAGNDGRSNSIDNPAASSGCVPVGAVDSQLRLASFSDRGPQMTSRGIVASGVRVYSCFSNGYGAMSGTSMATPCAAGQAALMIHAEEKFLGGQVTKTTQSFINLVDRFHVDLGSKGDDPNYGNGAFDVYSYIKFLSENAETPGGPEQPADPIEEPGNPEQPEQPQPKPVANFSHGGYRYTIHAESLK